MAGFTGGACERLKCPTADSVNGCGGNGKKMVGVGSNLDRVLDDRLLYNAAGRGGIVVFDNIVLFDQLFFETIVFF